MPNVADAGNAKTGMNNLCPQGTHVLWAVGAIYVGVHTNIYVCVCVYVCIYMCCVHIYMYSDMYPYILTYAYVV